MARKKRDMDYGGGGSWMDTYGDMITLVLTFFVLLFAMSTVDATKWKALVASVTGGISAIAEPVDPGPANIDDPVQMMEKGGGGIGDQGEQSGQGAGEGSGELNFMALYEKLVEYIRENSLEESISAEKANATINIRFSESLFFDTGKANIKAEALETIDRLMPFLEEYQGVIQSISVEGHTDNVPIHTSQFKDNWWLSYHRAGNVVDYLIHTTGLEPGTLSAVGYGEYRPIATNETVEGRAQNRRVQFVIHEMLTGVSAIQP